MLTYLIEVTICWTVLYALFAIAMRKETFFSINRWYLLSSIITGLLLPLLRFIQFTPDIVNYNEQLINNIPMATQFRNVPTNIAYSIEATTAYTIDYIQILISLYLLIMGLFMVRLLKGLLKIQQLYQAGQKTSKATYTLVHSNEEHLPFSFFRSVFISSSVKLGEDYERILQHELEHVKALHTVDIIFIEIIQALFWFHPMVYFYKSSIRQTHEYLADRAAYSEGSRKVYGQLLLRQSLSGLESALVHHFFHSHIKKRIKMIYQKKSGRGAWLKYFLAVPTLLLLTSAFIAQDQHLKTHINYESEEPLSKKKKKKLQKELTEIFQEYNAQEDWEAIAPKLTDLKAKWFRKHPKSSKDIAKTIVFAGIEQSRLFLDIHIEESNDPTKNITFINIGTQYSLNEFNTDESWPMPQVEDLKAYLKRWKKGNPNLLSKCVYLYTTYLPNYANNPKLLKELDQVFMAFFEEEEISFEIDIAKLHPRFNENIYPSLSRYKQMNRLKDTPLIWCKDHIRTRPIEQSIDLDKPIPMVVKLEPSDAVKIFGNKGRLGFYALFDHEFPATHPYEQRKALQRDLQNFFSTLNNTKENEWGNMIKSVHEKLLTKYSIGSDIITPFTTMAHEYDINLVFKDGEIIKAYRSTENGYIRMDTETTITGIQSNTEGDCTNNPKESHVAYVVGAGIESCADKSFDCVYETLSNFVHSIKTYPKEALIEGYQGVVGIQLSIGSDGSFQGYKISNKIDSHIFGIQDEVERIISAIKKEFKFTPGECNGIKVPSHFSLAITFKLDQEQLGMVMKVGKEDVENIEQHINVMTISKNYFTYQYRTNMNRPYEVNVIDPDGKKIFHKSYDYIYKSTHEQIDFPKSISGKYTIRIIQDGSVKEISFDRGDANNSIQSTDAKVSSQISKMMDTIITYNPETFEETISIQDRTSSIPDPYVPVTNSNTSDNQLLTDLVVNFNPETLVETVMTLSYPKHLQDQIAKQNIDIQLNQESDTVKLVGEYLKTSIDRLGIVNEEGVTPVSLNGDPLALNYDGNDELKISTSGIEKGTYYVVFSEGDFSLKVRFVKE